ncbi:T9SS C-terminal target domain-containing protein [Sphingobacterium alkalisoli]|uniref:T9SS C-terminal target domain-containing protein n=1 Tax=Sphingobacterium alkalisoli TaxID=1874115 RepID=A0A4U0H7T2_9SPHI|nr:T9SS C-terminal target domain-containing protein [Sphingobacterium alkalisoli]TJY67923.1 T9SS C-terminal target domain-containing protein [Sphingobacterium alkalisoli]
MKKIFYVAVAILIQACLMETARGQGKAPSVRIDFNMNGRSPQEVEYDHGNSSHIHWTVSKPLADEVTVNGLNFSVKKGKRGEQLSPTYYKASVQKGLFDARFTNDGVMVGGGNFAEGAVIDLIIKGLPKGQHSLQTFHNMTDNLEAEEACPIDIYVNNVQKVSGLLPTVRLERIEDIASARLVLDVKKNEDVVISFRAVESGAQPIKNVIINGFYLNAADVADLARAIEPVNGNEHVDVPVGGGHTLRWESAKGAQSHDIYFGKDSLAVASADRNSPLFKGNQPKADTTYAINNLYSMDTYYWRIDEVVNEGEMHKGEVWRFRTAQLAFEGAEGFGRWARGGRGGQVVYVDNLNDSGPGSLREAVTNDIGPRTIVFNVGGVIELKSRLVLSDRYVTVAGQTAPGKGILIRSAPFGIGASDAVVRFIRLRLGAGPTADGMGMNGNYSIMDHCSISWTIDESFSSRGAKNITLQRTLISEALNAAGHKNYPAGKEHGYAATISGSKGSFHHNLLAHCYGRNWSLGGGLDGNNYMTGLLDIRNNVVYNWGSRATDGGAHEVNFINNYYKPGAGTKRLPEIYNQQHENIGLGTQRVYFAGNVVPGVFDEKSQEKGRKATYSNGATKTYETFVDTPFFDAPVTTQSAKHAYKMVLSDVGATQPYFDTHDQRMIDETLAGTFSVKGSVTGKPGFPDHEKDAGGYEDYPTTERDEKWDSDRDGLPDWWEKIHGLNIHSPSGDFSDANADFDRDGFTNLDHYLQWMAQPHYNAVNGKHVIIDVEELSSGFESKPVYTVAKSVNGTATVKDSIVTFTPNKEGLCSFEFTVSDSDGHRMSRQVHILANE